MGDNKLNASGDERSSSGKPDITFVAIGYNEGATLRACLESVHGASLPELTYELIYVDAGSDDDSIAVANSVGVDRLLGGDRRRRAAECRNLGLSEARAPYVQFLDGDMTVAEGWPRHARAFLNSHKEPAAVCGHIDESNTGILFRALQIDWPRHDAYIRHCGGAALYRREILEHFGGFPEDVSYGEEPLLCWRIRNELEMGIYQLNQPMVTHDLGFGGFGDYWRRAVRSGATYAEIATRCWGTKDPLWRRELISHLIWLALMMGSLVGLIIGPMPLRVGVVMGWSAILTRKLLQIRHRGHPFGTSIIYALHTYFFKLPTALGELNWLLRRPQPPRPEEQA